MTKRDNLTAGIGRRRGNDKVVDGGQRTLETKNGTRIQDAHVPTMDVAWSKSEGLAVPWEDIS